MADNENQEEVVYSYIGDVSSLRKATEDAIGLLDQFTKAIKQSVNTDKFDVGKTAFNSFQRSINGVVKTTNELTKILNKGSDGAKQFATTGISQVVATSKDLSDVLDYVNSSTKLTSNDLALLSSVLKDTSTNMENLVTKANQVGASFKKIDTLQPEQPKKTVPTQPVVSTSKPNITDSTFSGATKSAEESAKVFQYYTDQVNSAVDKSKAIAYAQQLEKSLKQTSKSAMDSAKVFMQVDIQLEQLSNVASRAQAIQYAQQLEQSFSQASKSALESAKVFVQADNQIVQSSTGLNKASAAIQQIQSYYSLLTAEIQKHMQQITGFFNPVITKLQSFKSTSAQSFGQLNQLLSTVSAAFRRVSLSADSSNSVIDTSAKSHSKLQSVLSSISKLFKKETTLIDDEDEELDEKNNTLSTSAKKHKSLGNALSALGSSMQRESSGIKANAKNFSILNSATDILRRGFVALSGITIGNWLSKAANESIRYTETLNLFDVAMGNSIDKGREFVDTMSELYGLDPSSLMKYAGNFYQLTDAIGMADEASANLALGLTKATADISSLFNVDVDTVFRDLSSGMQGMTRAVRKYGMDLRNTTLQQTAYSLGLTQSVTKMSEANRQGLRFVAMMRQASNANGDFARTIETPANQLRIFKEQMAQLGRAIGDLFIGPLTTAISYINGFIMALRMAISFISSLFGIVAKTDTKFSKATKSAGGASKAIGGVGKAAKGAAKELNSMLAPFDELNILSKPSSGGGGGGASGGGGLSDFGALDPAVEKAIEDMSWKLDNVKMKANEVRDALLEFFGFVVDEGKILSWDPTIFEQNLIDKFPGWTKTIQATFDNWTDIVNSFKRVIVALGNIAKQVWENVVGFIKKFINDDTVSAFISSLADRLNAFADFLTKYQQPIADFITTVLALVAAFKAFKVIESLIAPVVTLISVVGTAIAPFVALIGVLTLVATSISLLYTNSESFAGAFGSLLSSVAKGIADTGKATVECFIEIGESLSRSYSGHIKPMLKAFGDAFAPILKSAKVVWNGLVAILQDAIKWIGELWSSTIEPVVNKVSDALRKIANIVGQLWNDVAAPIIENAISSITKLWGTTLEPILSNVISIISNVIQILLDLWNNVLQPVASFLADVLAPVFTSTFNAIWNVVSSVVENIGQSIRGIIEVLDGLIQFIDGVFSGDWRKAWDGIVKIFKGVWNGLAGVVKVPFNAVIGVINTALATITGAINGVLRSINHIHVDIPDWIPGIGGKSFGPHIGMVSVPHIPYLASGGVVTRPTMAMVGEGKYDEAVIPLGNSPQMNELIQRITEATNKDDKPIQVNVYVGDEQVAEYIETKKRHDDLSRNGG